MCAQQIYLLHFKQINEPIDNDTFPFFCKYENI